MNVVEYALIGYFVGILTTAPVGPVNIMAIRHAIHRGFRQGVFVGFGAVVADTIYAIVAVFGVSAVTQFIEAQFKLIEVFGGLLLILIGLKIWNAHPHLETSDDDSGRGFWAEATAAFLMTITNPGALLAFAAIFGSLGHWRPAHGDHFGAFVMVAGVSAGASSWWIMISALVTSFKARIDDAWLDRANHIAGIVLIAFGALIYVKLAYDYFAR